MISKKLYLLICLLALIGSCSDKRCTCNIDKSTLIQEYKIINEIITLHKVEQGAFGEYIDLEICDENNNLIEKISIRGEDSKPKLDSVCGKKIYISYVYPSSIHEGGVKFEIPFENIVLGDGLLNKKNLRYKYLFSGRYNKEM